MEPKNRSKSFWAAPVSLLAPRGRLRFVVLNLVHLGDVVKGSFKKFFAAAPALERAALDHLATSSYA